MFKNGMNMFLIKNGMNMFLIKNGMNMIMTILFLIVITFLIGQLLYYNNDIPNSVKESYFKMRAKLFQKSSIEYSIMALQAHNFNNGCVENLTYKDTMFTVKNTFEYYLTDCNNCKAKCNVITTKEENGTIKIISTITPNIKNINIKNTIITLQNL